MLIKADRSCLLVVDIQDRLLPAMAAPERVIANATLLLKAAARLVIPVLASEQYPKGLGHTEVSVAALLPKGAVVEKMHFSCVGDDGFCLRFGELGRSQAVVVGMETHVCVLQTVLDLLGRGTEVFVVADAVSSRTEESRQMALERMRQAGARIVTAEMVAFEWLARAGTPEFKDISKLVK
ncbi:MAG: hydrolase [Magnetospirillum sp. WYHS-4]